MFPAGRYITLTFPRPASDQVFREFGTAEHASVFYACRCTRSGSRFRLTHTRRLSLDDRFNLRSNGVHLCICVFLHARHSDRKLGSHGRTLREVRQQTLYGLVFIEHSRVYNATALLTRQEHAPCFIAITDRRRRHSARQSRDRCVHSRGT